jgi:hypothetical protein
MAAADAWFRIVIIGAPIVGALMIGTLPGCAASVGRAQAATAAAPEKPVAGKTVHFPNGTWSGLPETGPDKKVRQCVLVAKRARGAGGDGIDTTLSLIVGRGAGLALAISDDKLPPERVLDDQAEITVGDHAFPATAFTAGTDTLAFHPGDAAGVLAALDKAAKLRLHSDGAGINSGAMSLDLPADALAWLKACGKQFDIALDRPTDPKAGEIPAPRPRSPEVAPAQPTAAGPAGIEDKQKISGWDASELRSSDGKIAVCFIRRHYRIGSGASARFIGTFLMVSRAKGLTMMLKDSSLNLPEGKPVEATLAVDNKPYPDFTARMLGSDEIGIFPQHGLELARALGDGVPVSFDARKLEKMDFPVPSGILPWLRACARRSGIGFEPDEMKQ